MSDQSVKRWKPSQCAVFASGDMEFIEVSEHERIVAELKTQGREPDEWITKEFASKNETIAKQKRVIEKLKEQRDYFHWMASSGLTPNEADAHARKDAEISAIERGET